MNCYNNLKRCFDRKASATDINKNTEEKKSFFSNDLSVPINEDIESAVTTNQLDASENDSPKPTSGWVSFYDNIGLAFTTASVLSQGLFGGLLADGVIRANNVELSPVNRAVIDGVVGFTAAGGKLLLMRSYNKGPFKELADLNFSQISKMSNYNVKSIINGVFSLIGGGAFSYLSWLSFIQSADLASSYSNNFGDSLADVLKSPYFQVPIIIANFVASMLVFPAMQRTSFSIFTHSVRDLFSNTKQRKLLLQNQLKMNRLLNPLMKSFNSLVVELRKSSSKRDQATIDNLYSSVLSNISNIWNEADSKKGSFKERVDAIVKHAKSKSDLELINNISNILKQDSTAITPSLMLANLGKLLGFAFAALCIIGLSNFFEVGSNMATELGLEAIAPEVGAIDMVSMSLMAFISVCFYGPWIISKFASSFKKVSPKILTNLEQNFIVVINILMCGLGSTPNAYQSWKIADQNLMLIALSALSSFLIEVEGSNNVVLNLKEERVTKHLDPNVMFLFYLLKRLNSLSPEKL